MPKPKVTVLNQPKKYNPIEFVHDDSRDNVIDNTTDLETRELKARANFGKHVSMPANYDNSNNGTVKTAPPM